MHLNGKNVAVIGAGIGGLAAALAMAQRGAKVQVFEQAETLGEVGAGLQISANGIAVLQALGLDPIAKNSGNMPSVVELCDHKSGRVITRLPQNRQAGKPFLQLHRADLLADLAAACDAAGVKTHLGRACEVLDVEKGVVSVQPDQAFDAVIAADGVRSPCRATHFAGTKPGYTGQAAWRGLVPAQNFPRFAEQAGTRLYLGPKRHIVVYPLRDRSLINIVAVQERADWTAEGWNQIDSPANLQAAFADWNPYVRELLGQVEHPILWGFFAHPQLSHWAKGRVALLGDAAHPMLPYMAQGACMGLEDAWVLAAMLDRENNVPEALQSYEHLRKPRASKVQQTSLGNSKIFHAENPLVRLGLHTGMGIAGKIAPGLMTQRFDWIYDLDVTKAA